MEVAALKKRFSEIYPESKTPVLCRAPGRVNLIGEHTDYNGLPVLPMAIEQEIRIAVQGNTSGKIRLHNVRPVFKDAEFLNGPEIEASKPGSWENYCKAAVQGINHFLKIERYPGMNLLFSSNLTMAAGLSSSSALVVACALAYLKALEIELDKDISRIELAELLAEAEHFVGTRGGGMDQAAILNGSAGHSCKIDFFPLRVESAPLPQDCVIVVCDSLVKVRKSGKALARYNAGPRLCALACALVERQLQEEFDEEIQLDRLGDLWFGPLCLTYKEAEAICYRAVPEARMTLAQAATRLSLSPEEVRERWLDDLPEPKEGFGLQARLKHQMTEYRRVESARDALLAADPQCFGDLMNHSHRSCADDFRISGPELDSLVGIARDAGALGARLTGAGFGGATVNLVPEEKAEAFIETVTKRYYHEERDHSGKAPIFIAHASDGAGYFPEA